jgi:hypothetical protein
MKLEPFGVEIYAVINGYSRFIIWIYVGVSTRTAISVIRQYLDYISLSGFIPQGVRANFGPETVIISDAHPALYRSLNALPQAPSDSRLSDHFFYGKSTKN